MEALRGRLAGEVIVPGDSSYNESRKVFNAMHDKRPAVVARCAGTADVVAAVNFARQNGLVVAVRSGGHSVAGLSICDGGILIDLAGLKRIEVDPKARTARAGGGVLWGEFDAATQQHALHTPGGRVTTTGVGGFTTGGLRLDVLEVWPHLRQPHLRRGRAGRRPRGHRQRAGERRSLLGNPNLAAAAMPFSQMIILRIGQGVAATADGATAFSHRDADYLFHPISMWQQPADDERLVAASRAFCEPMRPYSTGGAYLNFTPEDRVRDAYGAAKHDRLVALKDRYDPGNLFRLNQNIQPSRGAGEPVRA